MRKIYTGLVSAKPPREVKGEDILPCALQEISSAKPTIMVPQGETETEDRIRKLLLFDAALTPPDMEGAYGIPAWALDTARLARAATAAKLDYPQRWHEIAPAERDKLQKAWQPYTKAQQQYEAAIIRASIATGIGFPGNATCTAPKLYAWQDVIDYARKLAEESERNGEQEIKSPSGKGKGEDEEDTGRAQRTREDDDGGEKDEEGQAGTGKVKSSNSGESTFSEFVGNPWTKGHTPRRRAGDRGPGKLFNEDSPDKLPMVAKRKKGLRRRPEDYGTFPKSFERWHVDRKVFRGVPLMKGGPKGRGTVLVDMSGSMSWSEQDFENLLNAMPECTVYGYCGGGRGGRWVLLGDRGRMAKISAVTEWLRNRAQGNCIDVPCLRKLGKMSAPRVWISDAGATGTGDIRSQYVIDLVAEAIVRGDIVRCRTAQDAVDYLLTGKAKRAYTGARAALMD